jgi:hypothetical protein
MDDFHQSAAPAVRPRRLTSGRPLLALVVVLALLTLIPGSALADRIGEVRLDAGYALAYDASADGEAPVDPAPPADPVPVDPAPSDPAPSDPPPAPSDPAPAPSEPAPAPSDPAPIDPAPAPSDPAPAPSEPVPPAEDTLPPVDPAPREGRSAASKPPAEEHQVLAGDEGGLTPIAGSAPVYDASSETTDERSARASRPGSAEADDVGQAKSVRTALRRLGIGTIAATPAAAADDAPVAFVSAPACTPIGTVDAAAPSQTQNGLHGHPAVPSRRSGGEPPAVRGPPAPLESPSAPLAVAGSGSAAPGGVSGERFSAILADQIVFLLDGDGASAFVFACCEHVAPAPANAAARAPPVA